MRRLLALGLVLGLLVACSAKLRVVQKDDQGRETTVIEATDYQYRETTYKDGRVVRYYMPKSAADKTTGDVLDALKEWVPLMGK